MNTFTIYTEDGTIKRRVTTPGPIELQLGAGELAIPGDYDDVEYVIENHTPKYRGKPSSNFDVWNGTAWVDPRSQTQKDAAVAVEVRARRDELLAACDWTQLPDVPASTRNAWHGYRQELRDISTQPGFPHSVVWPISPS